MCLVPAFSQLLQFQFYVGRGSAAIFGHATFQSFKKTEKHDVRRTLLEH